MNGELQVNSVVLQESAARLRGYVNNMRSTFERANATIGETTESWESNAAKDLRDQYESFSGTFEDFATAIEKYAEFLDKAAINYEELDQQTSQKSNEVLNTGYTTM